MDKIIYLSPSVIQLPENSVRVRNFLTYNDKSVQYQIYRLKQQAFRGDWVEGRIEELKALQRPLAGWEDSDGNLLTYSGLAKELSGFFKWEIVNNTKYPEPKLIPWAKKPFDMWDHQKAAVEAMVASNHGAISVSTGGGKSLIISNICKHYGLPALIVAPSSSIANQLYDDFVKYFGIKYVSMYGDGKKKSNKMFTISVAQAITRIEEGTEHWDNITKKQIFIFDESHQVSTETFEKIAMGIAKNAPYRFFTSATQMRNDGSEIVLKGITGPIVYNIEFKELVQKKILARPIFKMFTVPSSGYSSNDPKKETRENLYKNPAVLSLAADIANKSVTLVNRPTVILVEEFSQIARLYPLIKVPFVLATGSSGNYSNEDTATLMSTIPDSYKKMDMQEAINKFNSGEVKLLIGTSAVATGTDLKPTKSLIYLRGGSSEIMVKQSIGRGTRIVPDKEDCWVIDFLVKGSKVLERHAKIRKEIYESYDVGSVNVIGGRDD